MGKLLKVTVRRAAAVTGAAMALSLAAVPGVRAAGTEPVGAPLRGLDISAHQHAGSPIDWDLLARQGIRFAAVKVSEGTYYLNPYYRSDTRAAAAAGLPVMPYVFAIPDRAAATATASFAVSAMGTPRGLARLPLVVDLENDPYAKAADCYGLGIRAMIAWIAAFTARAEALTGKWPVIYTTPAWWQECTHSTRQFQRDPLWIAAFDRTSPTVPSPWQNWTFWQYDNIGSLAGIGHTDLDYYQPASGLPGLQALAKPKATHSPEPRSAHRPTHRPEPRPAPRSARRPEPCTAHCSAHRPTHRMKGKSRPRARADRRGRNAGERNPSHREGALGPQVSRVIA